MIQSPCRFQPCENGGTCIEIASNRTFKCQCAENFYGKKCKQKVTCKYKKFNLKTRPNACNISTQYLAILLTHAVRCYKGAGQTCATSCNIKQFATRIWPFSNSIQHLATCYYRVPAKRVQYAACNSVARCCVGMLRAFDRALTPFASKRSIL